MRGPWSSLVPKSLDANLAFRQDVLTMAGRDPAVAAQIRTMCAEDLLFYVNTFCMTYDPRRDKQKVIPFITYPFQDEAMIEIADCVLTGQDFAMPKSRDMGASWMGLTVFEWFWHFQESMSFLLVSRNEDYVDKRGNPKSLFWKIDFLHEHQPRWLLPSGRALGWDDPGRRLLHLDNADNGSVIDGESTTGDAGRGDRRTAMFIDEHAAFELNDGFRVLRATRDTTRCRGFNSTPQGSNNGFYEVVHETSAKVIRLHWSSHPEKAQGLYTTDKVTGQAKRVDDFAGMVRVRRKGEKGVKWALYPEEYPFILDGRTRSPWYDAECARCANDREIAQELDIDFEGSTYQFFDPATIHILRKRYCREPDLVGDLEFDPETLEPKRFVEHPKGKLSLWIPIGPEGAPPRGMRFVLGADVSAGTGASNSAASIVNLATGEKIGVWRDSKTRPNGFAKLCMALGKWFNSAYMIWDRSGPTGEVFTKRVIEHGYGYIYYRRIEKKVVRTVTEEPGYFLNPTAKTALFEDYREALADHRFINRSDLGMKECLQFIRKPDGTVDHAGAMTSQDPSGARTAHGDEAVADALASMARTDEETITRAEAPRIPLGCLAWRQEQKAAKQAMMADCLGEGW